MTTMLCAKWVAAWVVFFGLGCGAMSHNAREPLGDLLRLDLMHDKLETESIDLSIAGRCPGTLPLKVVNAEKGSQTHVFFKNVGHDHYLIPSEYIDLVCRYMEKVLVDSHLSIDNPNGKAILVSFEEVSVEGSIVPEGTVKLRIQVPELGHSQIYSAIEGSGGAYHTVAYGTHLAIEQFLNDPVFQKFVKCH